MLAKMTVGGGDKQIFPAAAGPRQPRAAIAGFSGGARRWQFTILQFFPPLWDHRLRGAINFQ